MIKLKCISKILLFLGFIMLNANVFSQIEPSDSLTDYFNKITEQCYHLSYQDSDSALVLIEQTMAQAEIYEANAVKADLLRAKGLVFFYRVSYIEALELFILSRDLSIEIGDESNEIKAMSNVALVYNTQGLHEKSLEMELEILRRWQNIGDEYRLGQSYNNIGVAYSDLNNYQKALEYYKKAVFLGEKLDEKEGLDLYYNNVGNMFLTLNILDSAKIFFDKGLNTSLRNENVQMQCNSLSYIGEYYIKLKDYKRAIMHLEEAMEIASSMGIVYEIESVAENLHRAYQELGLYKEAHDYYVLSDRMGDSANNIETTKVLVQLEAQIEFEEEKKLQKLIQDKKDLQSELKLKQQKVIRNFSIILLLLIASVLVYVYLNYRKKSLLNRQLVQQRDEILAQKEEIETQRDEIETLNHTKDKFFAIIAHDLKNPLGAIYSLVGIVNKEFDTLETDRLKKYIEQIFISSKKTFDLLDNLLHWAIVQTGSIKTNPSEFNLTAIIKDNIDLLTVNAKQKEVKIEFTHCSDCIAYGDQEMLTTIVRNLLQNAIKFSNAGSQIDFKIELSEEYWKVAVCDQGIGMSIEDQAFVFDLNFDKKKIGKSKEKGTGLGLMLCKEFVELNGGIIWVESELGEGSVFNFTVPAAK